MHSAAAASVPNHVVPLAAARRSSRQTERVIYEIARLRVADAREPAPRFAHLIRSHD